MTGDPLPFQQLYIQGSVFTSCDKLVYDTQRDNQITLWHHNLQLGLSSIISIDCWGILFFFRKTLLTSRSVCSLHIERGRSKRLNKIKWYRKIKMINFVDFPFHRMPYLSWLGDKLSENVYTGFPHLFTDTNACVYFWNRSFKFVYKWQIPNPNANWLDYCVLHIYFAWPSGATLTSKCMTLFNLRGEVNPISQNKGLNAVYFQSSM